MSGHSYGPSPRAATGVPRQLTRPRDAQPPAAARSGGEAPDEAASLDRAIEALEHQRALLGDAVVDTALAPLRARREELAAPRSEQRRLVTVVFADLVDFTVLSRELDPEDTREVVNAYFARWQRAIQEQGGVVEKFIGDAVMAVFGLERSFEDDAHRAVRSALAMLADLEELRAEVQQRYGVALHMRVGVDTGDVVVSTLGERSDEAGFVAVGPTVNRASRLQAAAPVDAVLVSVDTQRLLRGAFRAERQPGLRLKGIEEPVDAYLVLGERRVSFGLDPSSGVEGVETRTVGRDLQLRFLQDRMWDVTDDAHWRVVTVVGEPGVGKSRLLHDFDRWLVSRTEAVWWLRGRASPATRNSPNALLRDVVSARVDVHAGDPAADVRRAFITAFTTNLGAAEGPRLGVLAAAWLGYDVVQPGDEVPTHPQTLRDQGADALARLLREFSRQAPVVIMLEDLHWADEESLRWLDHAAPELVDSQVLVVATARPTLLETRPHWGEGLAHHVRLDVAALSRRESRSLVEQILSRVADLPAELVALVVDSAEGNPFYIEELVTWLIDAGVVVRGEPEWRVAPDRVGSVAVPSTLKGVLQSRLDSLTHAERDLLQRASAVGRVFWDAALVHMLDGSLDREAVGALLEGLRGRDLVLERETSRIAGTREFLFKHALLRDVAHDSMLRTHRERHHGQAAAWLAETAARAGREEEYAALVAGHLDQARDPAAAEWYLRAGRKAAALYALADAGRLLARAEELAPAEEPLTRFDVHLARESLLDRLGEREEQLAQIERMQGLGSEVDPPRRVAVLVTRARYAFTQSDYDEARGRSGEAVQIASALGRDDLQAEALLVQGQALAWADDPGASRTLLARAERLGDATDRSDVRGEALRYLGMVAGNVGDYATSLECLGRARRVFARSGDTERESAASAQQATTLYFMGRYAEAQAALEETLPIFRRAGHRYREAVALGNLGSVCAIRGMLADAERHVSEAIDLLRAMGELEATTTNLLTLAQVELFTGRFAQARGHALEAMAVAQDVGNRPMEAEARTRMVHVALVLGDVPTAVAEGRHAVEVAREASSPLDRGNAHLALAYALVRTDDELAEADAQFQEAAELLGSIERDLPAPECTVGRARVASARGDHAGAVALLEPVLGHLALEDLYGVTLPATMLRGCVDVLRAAGDPRADDVLATARDYVRRTAAVVGEELVAAYLSIAPNRALLD